jgi:hypothetical protein
MRRAILSFVVSLVVFAVYMYLFENNQLLSSICGRDTKQVVQILDMSIIEPLRYLEIIIASVLMGLSALSFGMLVCKGYRS